MYKRKSLILLLLASLTILSFSQTAKYQVYKGAIIDINCIGNFDSLLVISSNIVFTAYPELTNISIVFKKKKLKTIMAARPRLLAFFNKRNNRKYQIILSTNSLNNCDQLFNQISSKALTGILGHEFAHILTYNDKSSFQIIFYAIEYLINKKYIERKTDLITINRGFGNELLEYNLYILNSNLVSKKYLKNRSSNYLSSNEIQEIIEQ